MFSEDRPEQLNVKQEQWKTIEKEMERLVDEPEMLEPVVALNAVGLSTTNSCEGHKDHGRIVPWITIGPPNMPKEKYVGQKNFEQEIYRKNGISLDLLQKESAYTKEFDEKKSKSDDVEKLHRDLKKKYEISNDDLGKITRVFFDQIPKEIDIAVKEGILKHQTPEYIIWKRRQEELKDKASMLLKDFYNQRDVSENVGLILEMGFREDSFFIRNDGGGDYVDLDKQESVKERSKEEIEALVKRIELYRLEFKEFAKFLKDKFLTE